MDLHPIPQRKFIFKEAEGIKLPMFVYLPEAAESKPRSAVLCIHGGGWAGKADNTDWNGGWMAAHAKWFSEKGFVGAASSYRSFSKGKTPLSSLYRDCFDAFVFLSEHAKELNIDPLRIAVMGDSAGGHLAACLGTLGIEEGIKAARVIACNGIMDLEDPVWNSYAEEASGDISPLFHITGRTPPFLLMHGEEDKTVNIMHSRRFFQEMRRQGRDCELIVLPRAMHAFILWGYHSPDSEVEAYMQACLHFLERM